jgi:phosphatidylglycerophosphatase A
MISLQNPRLNKLGVHLALGLGAGKLKPGPGTWGSLAILPFAFLMMLYPVIHMLLSVVGLMVAVWSAQCYLKTVESHNQDPSEVVIDEMIGMLIALVWLPLGILSILVTFLIFRILDITKPFPISWFDKNGKGGIGIVADDVVAGIMTNMTMHFILNQGWLP